MGVSRFFRFLNEAGEKVFGEVPEGVPSQEWTGSEVKLLKGDPFAGLSRTNTKTKVQKVLVPIDSIPLILCIGLNYHSHATEAKMSPAKVPILFTKPADAATGAFDDVSVHPIAQGELDYEAELCVIIGKDAKDVSEQDALDYVLGYTAGNDVSARKYQTPDYSGMQFGFAKSFDGFAPLGPSVATKEAIPDPQNVAFSLKLNGQVRQKSTTADMIFSVRQIIAHLTQGTTLRKGTVIMTGTPNGVGAFMQPVGTGYIKNGDVVEAEFDGIGSFANKYVF